jgi:hypothetical protein
MSLAEKWLEIVSGVSAVAPVNLDALIEGGAQQHPRPVPDRFWPDPIFPPPSVRLWQWQDAEYSCIGIRVTEPVAQPRRIALRLASAAVERNVRPIILTTLPLSGFERYGFRTERLCGATPDARAACEAELMRFWNMAIVIDAGDVALLG